MTATENEGKLRKQHDIQGASLMWHCYISVEVGDRFSASAAFYIHMGGSMNAQQKVW